jgi:transcriptional regulator with XRE-family HTH domain
MYFKTNFRYLKMKKDVSISDIQEATGLTSVGNYPNGRAIPPASALIKLAKYFDVTVDDLLLKDLSQMRVEEPPVDYVTRRLDEIEAKVTKLQKEMEEAKKK